VQKLLTVDEVAARLNIRKLTVYRWVSTGQLPCVRLAARTLRFNETDIDRHIEKLTRGIESEQKNEPFDKTVSDIKSKTTKSEKQKKENTKVDFYIDAALKEIREHNK
jgi:excisionase family DNA binding protein